MHCFTINYIDGLLIENPIVDSEMVGKINENCYFIHCYFLYKKIKKKLETQPDSLGITATIEEIESENNKQLLNRFECKLNHWYKPTYAKYLIPYQIEIEYNKKICMIDTLDCKFKLVNFTLQPKNDKELYVWMNVIENFKKQMQCDISIKNDSVYETSEFDDFVDVKFKTNDTNKQFYLGLNIGRFYVPNTQSPDMNYHPDGLHGKNSLDIINDILYYYTTII